METIIFIYLLLMFIALYLFSLFVILTIRYRDRIFHSPEIKRYFSVSVLVPAYNEEKTLAETVKHVANLDYPKDKLEIIIINDGSKDRTKEVAEELAKKYENVRVLNKKNSGKADSLNKGIAIAKGELIAVVDSDSFPDRASLKNIVGYFEDENMSAVTSFVTIRNFNESFLAKIQAIEYILLGWSRKLLDFVDSVYVTNGPLSVYRKEFVKKVGGFDVKSVTEDIDITWNLLSHGYKTAMSMNARVSTICPKKVKTWFRQRVRWGVGGLQAISKYREMFFRKGIFGAFILPFVSFSIFLSIFTFLFSSYLIGKRILSSLKIIDYSVELNASIVHFSKMNFYPPIILFYLIVLFTASMIYYRYILKKVGYEKIGFKTFLMLSFYAVVYLMLYPIVWLASIYRFIRKDYRW